MSADLNPARTSFTIVPYDSTELTMPPRAQYMGSGGNLTLRLVDDARDAVLHYLQAGQFNNARVRFIRAIGATAGDLVRPS